MGLQRSNKGQAADAARWCVALAVRLFTFVMGTIERVKRWWGNLYRKSRFIIVSIINVSSSIFIVAPGGSERIKVKKGSTWIPARASFAPDPQPA